MGGAARIAAPALMRLFRLVGGDVGIFPNHGGRFGYSRETCLALAEGLRTPWGTLQDAAPTPAGGMTIARVPEMLDFYGRDTMLLIGGALLAAPPERLTAETAAFVRAVAEHGAQPMTTRRCASRSPTSAGRASICAPTRTRRRRRFAA